MNERRYHGLSAAEFLAPRIKNVVFEFGFWDEDMASYITNETLLALAQKPYLADDYKEPGFNFSADRVVRMMAKSFRSQYMTMTDCPVSVTAESVRDGLTDNDPNTLEALAMLSNSDQRELLTDVYVLGHPAGDSSRRKRLERAVNALANQIKWNLASEMVYLDRTDDEGNLFFELPDTGYLMESDAAFLAATTR